MLGLWGVNYTNHGLWRAFRKYVKNFTLFLKRQNTNLIRSPLTIYCLKILMETIGKRIILLA